MKKAKILAILLSVLICFPCFALTGCSQSSDQSKAESNASSSKPTDITYAFVTFNNVPSDTAPVEKAIDAITEKAINVRVHLKLYSVSNYQQQMTLMVSSGQSLDLFHTLGDLNQYISGNEIIPLDSLLDKYGGNIKSTVSSEFLKCTSAKDKLYAIPCYRGVAIAPAFAYRADILEEIGVSSDNIKSVNDLDAVFAKVKAKYPNMSPIAPCNSGDIGTLDTITDVDSLTDNQFLRTGVLVGDNTKVVNYYETSEVKTLLNLAHSWYNKGYIAKDAATTTTLAAQAIAAGQAFSYIAEYAGKESAAQISAQTGKNIGMVRIGEPYVATDNVNTISWVIPTSSKNAEAAMKFLDLTYSNKDVLNTLLYGIEGEDYTKVDSDHVAYPSGKSAQNVSYTAALSCGLLGNEFNDYLLEGQSAADLKLMAKENKTASRSKAFGFTFDSGSVKTQYSTVNNVLNQYLPGLRCGSLDPETQLSKLNEDLKEAGIDDIIQAKQSQLDDWLKEQK